MIQPLLIVVTGRPGAGKTTFAHVLGQSIACPVLSRDEFKEGYVNTLASQHGALDPEEIGVVNETFFAAVELLLRSGITIVAEAAFQHRLWAPKLEPLKDICRMRIVVCDVEAEVARARFVARSASDPRRRRFHGDDLRKADALITHYDPPRLSVPTIQVDTADGYRPSVAEVTDELLARHRGDDGNRGAPVLS